MDIGGELRRAIADSGLTLYRVAKDAGAPYTTLHDFAQGRFELRVTSANALLTFFDYQLTRAHKPAAKKPRKKRRK